MEKVKADTDAIPEYASSRASATRHFSRAAKTVFAANFQMRILKILLYYWRHQAEEFFFFQFKKKRKIQVATRLMSSRTMQVNSCTR